MQITLGVAARKAQGRPGMGQDKGRSPWNYLRIIYVLRYDKKCKDNSNYLKYQYHQHHAG